jgi:hypothetical protein
MAYTISLTPSITSDRETLTITDSTSFVSPIRSTVEVFLSGSKMKYDNTVSAALVITPNSTDPVTVTSWAFPYQDTLDGWYRIYYAIIKDAYSGATSYNIYDAVYDSGTKLVYRSKIGSNIGNELSDTVSWELITDPSTLAANKGLTNESTNIESIVYQPVFSYNAQYGYGNFVSENSEACCGDCESCEQTETYSLLSLLVNGAILANYRTQVVQGEVICRRLEAILETC